MSKKKISILLSKLNASITLHQCKLDKLQDVKKELLKDVCLVLWGVLYG